MNKINSDIVGKAVTVAGSIVFGFLAMLNTFYAFTNHTYSTFFMYPELGNESQIERFIIQKFVVNALDILSFVAAIIIVVLCVLMIVSYLKNKNHKTCFWFGVSANLIVIVQVIFVSIFARYIRIKFIIIPLAYFELLVGVLVTLSYFFWYRKEKSKAEILQDI